MRELHQALRLSPHYMKIKNALKFRSDQASDIAFNAVTQGRAIALTSSLACRLLPVRSDDSRVHRASLRPCEIMGRRRASYAAIDHRSPLRQPPAAVVTPRIGLALGGGFARGIAHAGVLRTFERHGVPLHCITGVSAGSIVAAAFASGARADDIGLVGASMRFRDVARWSLCRMGFLGSERMKRFLEGLLKAYRFEQMRIPLGIVATDLCSGDAVS